MAPAGAVGLSTARSRAQTLAHWERLTADPLLCHLAQTDVNQFRNRLAATMKATTANKHLRNLRAILNELGSPTARHPDALALVTRTPFIKLLPEPDPMPRHLTDDELGRLYRAADRLTWPHTIHRAADYWRTLLILAITYGPRIGDLLALTWDNVTSPDLETDRRWIAWTAQKTERFHRWPLTTLVNDHLARLAAGRCYGPPRRILITPKNPAKLYETLHRWAELAEIPDAWALGFHDFRATCAARYERHRPGLAATILGHAAPRTVTNRHYLGAAALADAYAAILDLKPPPEFSGT